MAENKNVISGKFGFYRGQVLKHLPNGYCKIWIPGIYDEALKATPDKLPNAEQAAPLLFGYQNERYGVGNGAYSYPDLNAIVWCFFQNGDQNFPVYFAATLGGENPTSNFKNRTGFTPTEVKAAISDEKIQTAKEELKAIQDKIAEAGGADRKSALAGKELQALYEEETKAEEKLNQLENSQSSNNFPNVQYLSYYKASIKISKDDDIVILQSDNFTQRQKDRVAAAQDAANAAEDKYHDLENQMAELQTAFDTGKQQYNAEAVSELEAKMEQQKQEIVNSCTNLAKEKAALSTLLDQGQIQLDRNGNVKIYAYETLELNAEHSGITINAPKILLKSTGNIEMEADGAITGKAAKYINLDALSGRVKLDGAWGWPVIAW